VLACAVFANPSCLVLIDSANIPSQIGHLCNATAIFKCHACLIFYSDENINTNIKNRGSFLVESKKDISPREKKGFYISFGLMAFV
jgi:hypothetical protein